jgi:transposase
MTRKHQKFSEHFKQKVVREVNGGIVNKEEAMRRYGIRGKNCVLLWQRNLERYGRCSVTLISDNFLQVSKKKAAPTKHTADQSARIRELERLLEEEQLRSEAYLRVIEKAEQELNVPIRKKSDTR